MWLLILFFAVGVSAQGGSIPCTNPGTGTATRCTEVANPRKSGPSHAPWSCGMAGTTTYNPCYCPADTCVFSNEMPPYSGTPDSYMANFPLCTALNGVGWAGITNDPTGCAFNCAEPNIPAGCKDTCTSSIFCTEAVRSICRYGDVQTGQEPYEPFFPLDGSYTHITCACDCGYTYDSQYPGLCLSTTSNTGSCQNPATGDFVNFISVDWPFGSQAPGACYDNANNQVRCFCPQDTCVTYNCGGSTCPECRVIDGMGITGYGWNTAIANNHAYVFCTEPYRAVVCNSHGDVPTGTTTVPANSGPIYGGTCTCDCGYANGEDESGGATQCSAKNFVTQDCFNPTTVNYVQFVPVIEPGGNTTTCPGGGPCWCPVDTCVAVTTQAGKIGVCLPPYTGAGFNTTVPNNNAFILCTQPYDWAVCNGRGSLPSQYPNYSPLAPYTNPPGPCTCDAQWWDTTYSDNRVVRCNFQSNCSISTRPGFDNINPCGGHGTCNRDSSCTCAPGWGGQACDQNTGCPSTSPNLECSGQGTCYKYTGPEFFTVFGGWIEGSFGRVYGFPVNISCPYSPPGPFYDVPQVLQYGLAFLFQFSINESPQPDIINNLPISALKTLCCNAQLQAGASNGCFRILLEYAFNGTLGAQWQTFLTVNGYNGNMQQYVIDSFVAYYPMLGSIDPSWPAPIATALLSSSLSVQAGALALLLSYEVFADFTVTNGEIPAPYPSPFYPQYHCVCDTYAMDLLSYPGGPSCSRACIYDQANDQVCGGVTNGFSSGTCGNNGLCYCSPGYVTATSHANPLGGCNLNLVGRCVLPSSPGQVCSTPGCSNSQCSQQNSLQGSCNIQTVNVSSPVAHCQCDPAWKGTYCQTSVCTNTTVECSFNGACNGASKQCVCNGLSSSNTQSLADPPSLWSGTTCAVNAITQCGHFIQLHGAPAGTGTWTVCNNVGSCKQNTTAPSKPYACFCTGRNFGAQCQFTGCSPACNTSTQFCSLSTGTCSCQTMWGGPLCNQNLCVHGHPNALGTACICDKYYTQATSGPAYCTLTQCPFVANTQDLGIRACNYTSGDQNCAGNPTNTVGCCYNGCPGGSCTVTNGQPTCACSPTYAFNQINGICFPICHAGSFFPTSPLVCNCAAVKLLINPTFQFLDGFCNIFGCANGGVAHSGGCTCPAIWTGTTCTTNACKNGGTPGTGTSCVCAPNYTGQLCATFVNPNPPDPQSSSSTGATPRSSSSSSTGGTTHSSSSTGTSKSSSTGSTHTSSSSSGSSHTSSSSSGSGSVSSSSSSTGSTPSTSSSALLSTGEVIGIAVVASAVGVTGIVLLGIFLQKLVTGSGPAWAALPKSTTTTATKTSV